MKRQPRQQITWMTSSWVICYLHLVTLSPRHSPPSTPPAHEREERVPERREGMSDTSEGAAEAVRHGHEFSPGSSTRTSCLSPVSISWPVAKEGFLRK